MYNRLIDLSIKAVSADLAITLADAKKTAIVDFTDDDQLITDLITQVTKAAENWLLISITPKNIVLTADWCREWKLPRGPHYSVDSVEAKCGFGEYSTLTLGTDYIVDGELFKTLNATRTGRLRITYRAGYGNFNMELPDDIKQGLLQEVANRYQRRGDEQSYASLCPAAVAYLQQHRDYSWQ